MKNRSLEYAILNKNIDVVKILLEAGTIPWNKKMHDFIKIEKGPIKNLIK